MGTHLFGSPCICSLSQYILFHVLISVCLPFQPSTYSNCKKVRQMFHVGIFFERIQVIGCCFTLGQRFLKITKCWAEKATSCYSWTPAETCSKNTLRKKNARLQQSCAMRVLQKQSQTKGLVSRVFMHYWEARINCDLTPVNTVKDLVYVTFMHTVISGSFRSKVNI